MELQLQKLSNEQVRDFDAAKSRDTELLIRRELVNIRMDIYTAKNQHTGKIRGLKKSLARVLTHRSLLAAATPKAPKAPKAAAAPKAPKAPKVKTAEAAPKAKAAAKTKTAKTK
jgi:ribosomal protein L29